MPVNIGPFRGYSVFDSLMRDSINRKYSPKTPSRAEQIATGTAGYDQQITNLGIGGTTSTGPATSPFLDRETTFVKTDDGVVGLSPEQLEPGLPMDSKMLSRGEAAVESATPTGLREYGRTGRVAQAAIAALSPEPFGLVAGLMGGSQTVDPYGKKAAIPGGILGLVAKNNIEQQYDIYDKVQARTPGYHQFYAQGQLVSIVPQDVLGVDVGFAALGNNPFGTNQEAINAYAVMYGFDPSTVDLNKSPDSLAFGKELDGFVPGTGGIGVDGQFVDAVGNRSPAPRDVGAYVGMVNEVYGRNDAIRIANTLDPTGQIASGVVGGTITTKTYMTPDGNIAGYGTGTGGIVTDRNGNPVMGGGKPVGWGTGYVTPEQVQQMRETGDGQDGDGFTPASEEETSLDQSPNLGTGMTVGYAAQGGMISRTPMQEGGQVPPEQVPPGEAPVATEPGFVEQPPENLPEGMTVADDVPMEVPEGTFVLNAAAVEFMGSADVKTMILEAIAEAEKQGVDIQQENSTIAKEDLISLVVSRGEVIIPPQLAQIIGYDRLNKINNRGKAEVEKRIEENGQSPEAQQAQQPTAGDPPIAASRGGFIDRLREDLGYTFNESPDSASRVINRAREANPEGFAVLQDKNTDSKIEALNRIQFDADEILAKSPVPLRNFDKYLLDQAPYYLQISYGSEEEEDMPVGIRGQGIIENAMGVTSAGRKRTYYPGEMAMEDTTYLHETGHAEYPYDMGLLNRAYTSFASLAGLEPPDQPDDENAVTTLDLYRGLSSGNEAEIKQSVGYLMQQHSEIPGTPSLQNDASVDILKERALRYVFDIADKASTPVLSPEERQNLAADMERTFNQNRSVIRRYANEYMGRSFLR